MTESKALLLLAGFLVAFLPVSQSAAQSSIGGGNPMNQLNMPEKQEDPRVIERREAVDREYRATRGALSGQPGQVDPWANMRGAEEAKPASKQSANAPKKKPSQ